MSFQLHSVSYDISTHNYIKIRLKQCKVINNKKEKKATPIDLLDMMQSSNNNNKLPPIDPIDQYIKEIPESLHDIIYCWDRPHQLFRNMIDEKKDMNTQKDFDIKPRKIEVHELEWLEQVLNENAFLRAKKLQERKLLRENWRRE